MVASCSQSFERLVALLNKIWENGGTLQTKFWESGGTFEHNSERMVAPCRQSFERVVAPLNTILREWWHPAAKALRDKILRERRHPKDKVWGSSCTSGTNAKRVQCLCYPVPKDCTNSVHTLLQTYVFRMNLVFSSIWLSLVSPLFNLNKAVNLAYISPPVSCLFLVLTELGEHVCWSCLSLSACLLILSILLKSSAPMYNSSPFHLPAHWDFYLVMFEVPRLLWNLSSPTRLLAKIVRLLCYFSWLHFY
jgi:hypothetical protein